LAVGFAVWDGDEYKAFAELVLEEVEDVEVGSDAWPFNVVVVVLLVGVVVDGVVVV
jgi:hypothetical protein